MGSTLAVCFTIAVSLSPVEAGHSAAQGTTERLRAVLGAGDPAHSGGATDASVRLNNLLKVRGFRA
jgi:hypothetical protein